MLSPEATIDPRSLPLQSITAVSSASGRRRRTLVLCAHATDVRPAIGTMADETTEVGRLNAADEVIQKLTARLKPKREELANFYDGMARALKIGTTVGDALKIMASMAETPVFRGVLCQVISDVGAGTPLAESLARHPAAFDRSTVALFESAERSGAMVPMLEQLARAKLREVGIWRRLAGGMVYPAIVLLLAVGVVVMMSMTFLPNVEKAYRTFKSEMPRSTTIVLRLGREIRTRPYVLLLPLLAIAGAARVLPALYRTRPVQVGLFRVPVIGGLMRKMSLSRSLRTLALLLRNNVKVLDSFEIVAEVAGHVIYRAYFLAIREHLAQGRNLFEAFSHEHHRVGPDGIRLAAFMRLATETGQADELFRRMADTYEDDLDQIAGKIDRILEPFTMVTLGVIVGYMVFAIYYPMIGLAKVAMPGSKAKAPAAVGPAVPGSPGGPGR